MKPTLGQAANLESRPICVSVKMKFLIEGWIRLVTARYGHNNRISRSGSWVSWAMKMFEWGLQATGTFRRGFQNASQIILKEQSVVIQSLPDVFGVTYGEVQGKAICGKEATFPILLVNRNSIGNYSTEQCDGPCHG
jgi:hypothetical protein